MSAAFFDFFAPVPVVKSILVDPEEGISLMYIPHQVYPDVFVASLVKQASKEYVFSYFCVSEQKQEPALKWFKAQELLPFNRGDETCFYVYYSAIGDAGRVKCKKLLFRYCKDKKELQ